MEILYQTTYFLTIYIGMFKPNFKKWLTRGIKQEIIGLKEQNKQAKIILKTYKSDTINTNIVKHHTGLK